MNRVNQKKFGDEAPAIRREIKSMTTAEISKEVERLRRIDPNSQMTILFAMELKVRQMIEQMEKEGKIH
ncbi:MAG: hypothetical protein K6F04_02670 [bacterium]|nr:hypothetical protein [bacterium]